MICNGFASYDDEQLNTVRVRVGVSVRDAMRHTISAVYLIDKGK